MTQNYDMMDSGLWATWLGEPRLITEGSCNINLTKGKKDSPPKELGGHRQLSKIDPGLSQGVSPHWSQDPSLTMAQL